MKVVDDILESSKDYRKWFTQLKWRDQTQRAQKFVKDSIGVCIDRKCLKKDGYAYLMEEKRQMTMDTLAFLEVVTLQLEAVLKILLNGLDNLELFCVVGDVDPINNSNDFDVIGEKLIFF